MPTATKQAKKKNCTSGKSFPCGYSCQPMGRKCRNPIKGQSVDYQDWLKSTSAGDKQDNNGKEKRAIATYKKRLAARDRKLAELRAREAYPKAPAPGSVMDFDVNQLEFDPNRFQYKLVHGSTGSSGSLTGVRKWDSNLAGIVQVWTDPADGKTYVVNGHNRANLAKNLGVEKVTVRFLDVKDAKEARAVGALTNIAEGRGNPLDAAKFFRDSGISKQDLKDRGIPLQERIANEGLAIAGLPPDLFNRVVLGDISMPKAVEIGGSGLGHTQQRSLLELVEKSEKKGKAINTDTLNELIDIVKSSETVTTGQMGLFGLDTSTQNLAVEKARLQGNIKRRLSREKKLFGTVSKSKAAQDLEKAGNVIEREQSAKIAEEAEIGLRVFDSLKNLSGPVSDSINKATQRIANGESAKKVEDELYQEIARLLPTLARGGVPDAAVARQHFRGREQTPSSQRNQSDTTQSTLFGENPMIINFNAVDTAQDFINFAASGFQLPSNPTPKQFAKAEPILIQQIIEQNYDTGAFESRNNGEYEGDIIDPIDMSKVRRVKPGHYVGEFSDEGSRYRFEISDRDVTFSPIGSSELK